MPDDRFPVEVVEGVPVLAAPEEIDITNAEALRTALLNSSHERAPHARGRHDPDPVLRCIRASRPGRRAQANPSRGP